MIRRILLTCVLVVAGFAAGMVVTGRMRIASESVAEPAAAAPAEPQRAAAQAPAAPAVTATVTSGPDFTKIAGQSVKGVANISSLQVVRRPNSPFQDDPFFQYFFGDQDMYGARDRRSMSLGSGVIISADGYIVTNNHVVGENVREITVALSDNREVKGRVIGTDPATDIALLKVDLKGLPAIPWGDSAKLQVGEWVLAINTGIFSQSGGYQGIGFAVPSNLVQHIVNDLREFGEVQRGTIGGIVTIDKLTPQVAEEVGAPNTSGALVIRMMRGSEAYNAGVRPGDVITGFNGTKIDDPSQLYRLVADAKIGSMATIKVFRAGRTLDLKVPIVSDARSRR